MSNNNSVRSKFEKWFMQKYHEKYHTDNFTDILRVFSSGSMYGEYINEFVRASEHAWQACHAQNQQIIVALREVERMRDEEIAHLREKHGACLAIIDDLLSLKPCPFCGKVPDLDDPDTIHPDGTLWRHNKELGARTYHRMKERQEGDSMCYVMNCPSVLGGCGVEIHADSKEDVINAWNKRV